MANDKVIALTATSERPASTTSGYLMLIVLLLVIVAAAFGDSTWPMTAGRHADRRL